MTMQELAELIATDEPLLRFHNIDYQILFVQGRCLIAIDNDEATHTWFDNMHELLSNWTPDGVPIAEAVTDMKRIWYADLN